jgi:hypothetical protein
VGEGEVEDADYERYPENGARSGEHLPCTGGLRDGREGRQKWSLQVIKISPQRTRGAQRVTRRRILYGKGEAKGGLRISECCLL